MSDSVKRYGYRPEALIGTKVIKLVYPGDRAKAIHKIEERRTGERSTKSEEREKLITKLQEAFENIKTLKGLLPICANCKKIRDDNGYWSQIEAYIRDRSDAEFSHSICPDCANRLYSDL